MPDRSLEDRVSETKETWEDLLSLRLQWKTIS